LKAQSASLFATSRQAGFVLEVAAGTMSGIARSPCQKTHGSEPMPIILWLLGVPLSIVIVLWLIGVV
jgi:hypothetical protein